MHGKTDRNGRLSPSNDGRRQHGFPDGYHVVAVTNRNCPGQIIIAGEAAGVATAMARCSELGAKHTVKLPVSAPFHTVMLRQRSGRIINIASVSTMFWRHRVR